ncbi:MAG: AsmA family protein [Hyphomicrobiales bacterium]
MRRILTVTLVVLALVAGLWLAFPHLLPSRFAVDQLAAAVKDATGRTLTVRGPVTVSLWPKGEIEMRDVVVSNPPEGDKGQVAEIEAVKIAVDASALLSRRLDASSVTLLRPRLSLITNGEGKANWLPPDAPGDGAAPPAGKAYPALRIEDGDIRYLDERSGLTLALANANLTITPPGPDAPLGIDGHVTFNKQRAAVSLYVKSPHRLIADGSPVDLAIDAPEVKASYSGRMKLGDVLSLAGTAEMTSPSLRDLARWAGVTIAGNKGLGEASLNGAVDLTGRTLKLQNAALALDGMRGQGTVTLDFSARKPRIEAALGVDRVDVNAYLPDPKTVDVVDGWSEAPLTFEALKAIDLKLDLAAHSLFYGDIETGSVKATATLNDGMLDATIGEAELYGGTAKGIVHVDSKAKAPALSFSLKGDDIAANRLMAALTGADPLDGKVSFDVTLDGSGTSELEMVSMLKGTAGVKVSDGAIKGVDVAKMLADVKGRILTGWEGGAQDRSPFTIATATFSVQDGIGTTGDLMYTAKDVQISGSGTIDLLRRALDLRISAQPQGDAKGEAVSVLLKGPWASPRALKDVAANPPPVLGESNPFLSLPEPAPQP